MLPSAATLLTDATVFFLVISTLIIVHELGHLLAAKAIGVGVEEFGLGLPPRIVAGKFRGILYSLNWLPVGGFVRLAGEDEENPPLHVGPQEKKYFWARSPWERSIILLAGVFMNFILAVLITSYLLTGGLRIAAREVSIVEVQPGTPGELQGLAGGDVVSFVLSYDELGIVARTDIVTAQDLQKVTQAHLGYEITLAINRNSRELLIPITPRQEWPEGQGPIGIRLEDTKVIRYPWWAAPWESLKINIVRIGEVFVALTALVGRVVRLESVGGDVAGPIRIAQVTSLATRVGFRAIVELTSIISLNLTVLNILPIPALDGGRLLFVVLEKIIGRRIRPAFERSSHQIGMIILLFLVFLISINDILLLARGI